MEGALGEALQILAILFHPTTQNLGWVYGGSEKRFAILSRYLKDLGCEISAIEPFPSVSRFMPAGYDSTEIDLISAKKRGPLFCLSLFEWTIEVLRRMDRLVAKKDYDVIYLHNGCLFDLLPGYIASKKYSIPVVVVQHHLRSAILGEPLKIHRLPRAINVERKMGADPLSAVFRGVGGLLETRLDFVELCLCVSRTTAEQIKSTGIAEEKIIIVGNGVDIDYIDSFVDPVAKKYDAVYVGRLHGAKGFMDLLKAWKLVIRRKRDAKLLIIGGHDVASKNTFKAISKYSLNNNIELRGFVPETELYEALKSGKIFLFPSKFEGWGLAVAEALACGLPVVAYDIAALRENFGNCKSVALVETGDYSSLADSTLSLLDLRQEDLRYASRQYALQFSWEEVARKESLALDAVHNDASRS